MTVETKKIIRPPAETLVSAVIGDMEGFKRIAPSTRKALFGYFLDYLMIVCRDEFPMGSEVRSLIARKIMYEKLGVARDLIGRGELGVLASQIYHLQGRKKSDDLRSKPGELWTNVMMAVEMNVTGFGDLDPIQFNTIQNHLRVLLTTIDGNFGRNSQINYFRLPNKLDALRYQQSIERTVATGIKLDDIKHAGLISAAVFIRHYRG